MGALLITYTVPRVPSYRSGIICPQTLFLYPYRSLIVTLIDPFKGTLFYFLRPP